MPDETPDSLESNPFRDAISLPSPEDEARRRTPFERDRVKESPTKREQMRTIAELDFVDKRTLEKAPQIRDLKVHDLNDLAREFSGVPTGNDRIAKLTIEDIQDIEAVFLDIKLKAGRELVGGATDLAAVDVSCCCCTPCCCCAATDMSHTAA